MNKTMKKCAAAFMFLFLCYGFLFSIKAQEKKKGEKEIIFGVALDPMIRNTSAGGKGSADMREIFQIGADEFKKLYGYTFTLKIFPAPKFLFKAIQDKTVDFAVVYVLGILYAKNHGISVQPFLVPTFTGKKESKHCLYVHKDSGIKTIKQLEGKRFVSDFPYFMSKKDALPPKESYIDWVLLKKTLLKNGIDKPFTNFFKEFWVLPVALESVVYSVMLNKFDACFTDASTMQSLRNYDKGFHDVVPLYCMDIPAPNPLVYRKDLAPGIVKTAKNYFFSPPKGSALQKVLEKEFKGIKAVAVEDKDYALYFQWLKEAEKKGWLKEFDEIMSNVMKESKEKGKSKYIYEGEK